LRKKIEGEQNRERPCCNLCPAVQNNLRELILDTAEKKIPSSVWLLHTGTDTDAFAYSNGGVVSA
jgi:hypothetical protein